MTALTPTEDSQPAPDRSELLGRFGMAISAELELDALVQAAIDAATTLIEASYGAFFEHVPSANGDDGKGQDTKGVWRLFSLCGAEREAFTRFGLPRATALFGPTFEGQGVVRASDVLADPRYGSMGGLPQGHLPVRSYLACPVVSREGVKLGALLFGHVEPGRFDAGHERLAQGFAVQTAIALDNARLYAAARREIEERTAAEASLRRSEARFRAAVDAVQGVVWTNDAQGRMSGDQPGWSALTGQTLDQYHGHGWSTALHPDDVWPTLSAWDHAVATRTAFVAEHRVKRRDGAWRTFVVRAVPVLDASGAVIEWVGVHTDITEQRKVEADLRHSNDEVQRYAHVVSHDLRSPLLNIVGFTAELELLRDPMLAAGAAPADDPGRAATVAAFDEAIGFVRVSVRKMERLIAGILRIAREGRREFFPEPIDMGELMTSLAAALRHQIMRAGAEVVVHPLPELTCDRLALEQVFANLLDNAVKYLSPDRPGRIEVSGEVQEGRVRYLVRDNGRGIAPGDRERIFELFRRVGADDRPGEGVGLAHVRALVRALGGGVEVISELGQGSTFMVWLPRR